MALYHISQVSKQELEKIPTQIKQLDCILEGGFPRKTVSVMAGQAGIGKTRLCVQILKNLSTKYKILFFENEVELKQFSSWSKNIIGNVWLSDSVSIEDIEKEVAEVKPDFVFFDSLSVMDFTDGKILKDVMGRLRKIVETYNCHLMMITHLTKDFRMKGSSDIGHLADIIIIAKDYIEINKIKSRSQGHFFLEIIKNRYGKSQEWISFKHEKNEVVQRLSSYILREEPGIAKALLNLSNIK
jgi:DNA repair protein RadA/Sms